MKKIYLFSLLLLAVSFNAFALEDSEFNLEVWNVSGVNYGAYFTDKAQEFFDVAILPVTVEAVDKLSTLIPNVSYKCSGKIYVKRSYAGTDKNLASLFSLSECALLKTEEKEK